MNDRRQDDPDFRIVRMPKPDETEEVTPPVEEQAEQKEEE